jgi:glutamate dehydrogenase/leucine dehydrogenase
MEVKKIVEKIGMPILWAMVIISGLGTIGALIWAFFSEKKVLPIIICISSFSISYWTIHGINGINKIKLRKNKNNRNKNHAPNPSIEKIIKL